MLKRRRGKGRREGEENCRTPPLYTEARPYIREEKGTQTQTFWSGCPPVGWGSSTWRGGGRKVRYVRRNQGNQTFWLSRRCPKSLRKKEFVFNFRSLQLGGFRPGPFAAKSLFGKFLGKEKNNKHKEFWRDAPWWVSRLSRGNVPSVPSNVPSVPRTFCPLNWNCPHKSAQTSRVSLGRPEFIPGTLPGHSDDQIPLCDCSLSVFSLPIFAQLRYITLHYPALQKHYIHQKCWGNSLSAHCTIFM